MNEKYEKLEKEIVSLKSYNNDLLYRLQKNSFRDFIEVFDWSRIGIYQGIKYYFQQNHKDKYIIDVWNIDEKRLIGNLYCFSVWFTLKEDFEKHEKLCNFAEIPEKKLIWIPKEEAYKCDSCNITLTKKIKCNICPSYYCSDCYNNFPKCSECYIVMCPSCSTIKCEEYNEEYHSKCDIDHHIRCH